MNQVHYLIDNSDHRLDGKKEPQEQSINFYERILVSASPPLAEAELDQVNLFTIFRCSTTNIELLISLVTEEDIKRELFDQPANKAPGHDSYSDDFFSAPVMQSVLMSPQRFWNSSHLGSC